MGSRRLAGQILINQGTGGGSYSFINGISESGGNVSLDLAYVRGNAYTFGSGLSHDGNGNVSLANFSEKSIDDTDSPYTILEGDNNTIIYVDTTGGDVTIDLDTSVTDGNLTRFRNIGTNNIIFDAGTGTLNAIDDTNYTQYTDVDVWFDGSEWHAAGALGPSFSFSNGLQETAGAVTWGGPITGTKIFTNGGSGAINFGNTGSSPLSGFDLYSDYANITATTGLSSSIIFYTNTGTNEAYMYILPDDAIGMYHNNGTYLRQLRLSPTGIEIIDDEGLPAAYNADYSGNLIDRSIPDYGAVTSQIGGNAVAAAIQSPGAGQHLQRIVWNDTNQQYEFAAAGGGGGSPGGSANELQKNDGASGFTGTGVFSDTNGNILLGESTGSGTRREIEVQGTETSIGLRFSTKGFGRTEVQSLHAYSSSGFLTNGYIDVGTIQRWIRADGTDANLSLTIASKGTEPIILYPGDTLSSFNINDISGELSIIQTGVSLPSGVTGMSFTAMEGNSVSVDGKDLKLFGGNAYSVSGDGSGGTITIQSGQRRIAGTGEDGSINIDAHTGRVNISADRTIIGASTGSTAQEGVLTLDRQGQAEQGAYLIIGSENDDSIQPRTITTYGDGSSEELRLAPRGGVVSLYDYAASAYEGTLRVGTVTIYSRPSFSSDQFESAIYGGKGSSDYQFIIKGNPATASLNDGTDIEIRPSDAWASSGDGDGGTLRLRRGNRRASGTGVDGSVLVETSADEFIHIDGRTDFVTNANASVVITEAYRGKIVKVTAQNPDIVLSDLSDGFQCIILYEPGTLGTGTISGYTTLNSVGGADEFNQEFAQVYLVHEGSNVWYASGNLV